MDEQKVVWFLPNEAGQPAGPYSSNQILEQLNTRQMSETTLCWREGMPDWQPLTEVEPFAAEIKTIKTAARKRIRRIVITISCVICVIAAAAGAYLIMMGPPELRRAKKLMAAGLYTETSEVLGPYVYNNPLNSKTSYLLAIANVYDYATSETERMGLVGGFWGTKTFLEQAKELLGRAFKADPKLIEKAKTDIADAAVRIPADAPDALNRSLMISRLQTELNLADKKYLAGELLKKLISQGAFQGQYGLPQEAVLQVLDWDSSLGGQIITHMLGDENATSQQLSMIVTTLQRWARERPAFAQILSVELLNRSKLLGDAGQYEQVKILISKTLEIDPQALKTEDYIFLYIRVTEPSNEKLTRCQLFLRDYPDSPWHPDVLLIIVRDATAVSKPYSENLYAPTFPREFGGRNRNLAQLYLSAGLDATKKLISRNPKMSNLDLVVFELAKRIAGNNQFEEAIDLMSDLLKAVPDSAIKLQIEEARAQWRQQSGKGTLAPEFDALSEQVEKKLNIKSLTIPTIIRTLIADSKAVHVIEVTDSCSIDKFNTEEVDMLRQWVADGGILWANNDVLKIFSIGYTSDFLVQGQQECECGILPQVCPILTGCSRVVVNKKSKAARNLSYVNVIPLLTCNLRGEKYAYWSLVPYGKGWVSDVKTVDRTKFDGARFWLNFQLFCLGWDIPGAEGQKILPGNPATPEPMTPPIQPPNIGASQYARISDTADLNKALDSGAGQQIIWVALTRNEVDLETQKKLRSWISEGGTLWVETDLVESFGFSRLSKVTSNSLSGQAAVAPIQDPIVSGLSGAIVNFELDSNGSVIKCAWSIISRSNIRPLLVQPNIQDDITVVICAARDFGNGFVILRPAKIDSSTLAGQAFESRLRSFSLSSKDERQVTIPKTERRRPTIIPRRRR